ncbi:MAG: IS21-like element helper ATPase IstB [Spirochaeta sp.]|jgi:DNA replication protein DnaC|nr:IS21-like element helper ATPase IstB [Spirochaeta sp.]
MIATARDREQTRREIAGYSRGLMLSAGVSDLCATEATPKQEEFLHRVLAEEMARRDRNRKTRLLSRAGFPVLKSFTDYDFSGIRFPPALTKEELVSCRFIAEKKNLVLYGGVGTGKTHMSLALGIMACEMSLKVRFYTVTELVLKLSDAYRTGTMERLVRDLKQLDLLILDEWGYVPVDREGSQLLFRIIADSYESKSLILTTNLEFSRWGSVFTDEQMAAAMIDRLVHHGHLLMFESKSYRMTHALMRHTAVTETSNGKGTP